MRIVSLCAVAALGGCQYEEQIQQADLKGQVRIPIEALQTLQLVDADGIAIVDGGFTLDADGNPDTDITDRAGLIGPVYLGAYAGTEDISFAYPHPSMGPILDADRPGDTYPYGGTSVGRFDYGCYEQLVCKIVTGRYSDYDEIIDFFRDVVQDPIKSPDQSFVTSGAAYQEHCFETEHVTSNTELSFIDDNPHKNDAPYFKPYFELNEEGTHYVADVTIPHTLVVEGMRLWGWVDMPSARYNFSSCDESEGAYFYRYSEQFYKGSSYPDLLNYPGTYIDSGDWVATPVIIAKKADDEMKESGLEIYKPGASFVIDLNIHFED